MKIDGVFTCSNPECEHINNWEYLIPNFERSHSFKAVVIRRGYVQPFSIEDFSDRYEFKFNCIRCDEVNLVIKHI